MILNDSQDRRRRGLWVHWLGDLVSATVLLITIAIAWGQVTTEVKALKERQTAIEAAQEHARLEMKADIYQRLDVMQRTLERIDDKLDRGRQLGRP